MPCCGKGRIARPVQSKTYPKAAKLQPAEVVRSSVVQSARWKPGPVLFQYTGHSGMTVFGPVTGLRYRFTGPGAVIAVDPRDAPSVDGVPRLQRFPGKAVYS